LPGVSLVDEKIIRIATYSNPVEAEMAKNYLEDAEITVFSAGAEASTPFAGIDAGFANIELHVPQSHYERAIRRWNRSRITVRKSKPSLRTAQ
jgi:hypothetical protein